MKFRAFDIAAVVVVLFVVLLPTPTRPVYAEYEGATREQRERIAALQAEAIASPQDLDAVVELTDELIEVDALQAALRTILPVAAKHPDAFQVQLSASDVWVQFLDFVSALPYAEAALQACDKDPACNQDWRSRLTRYRNIIAKVVAEKIDAKKEPEKLNQIVAEMYRTTRLHEPRVDPDGGVPNAP